VIQLLLIQKLVIIIKALNEGWKPNWNDRSECKYYPWFDLESGFVLRSVSCNREISSVGYRLCFKSETLAKYAAAQFVDLYKDFFIIK
jgi:hypothetical protein